MKILQFSLFIVIYIFAIISLVVSESEEQTTPTTVDTTTSNNAIVHNKIKFLSGNLSGNKTNTDGKRKIKARNQNKLFKLKKLILETENKTSTSDKNVSYTNKKSNENSTESATTLRNKTKHQLMILQKELRRLTKIADKLSELNEIYSATKPQPTKKKTDGDIKGKKNSTGKKGISNRHKPHFRISHGDGDSGKRLNELQSKNKGNDENKPGKWKGGRKKNQTTVKPNSNNNTTTPTPEKGRVVTSHINTRQFKRKNNKKNDGNTFLTTLSPKTVNTSLPPPTTILPQ
uniref:Uncharacterized protein n=1 Tax=Strongyloides papillosus TaxID=174720 RepID=A0A0N5BG79_STREA